MKKLLLAATLGLCSFAANAGNKVQTISALPACPGASITIQFIEYEIGPCTNNGYSPVYPFSSGTIYDLDNPATWAPTILQSYQTYSAIISITCPGMPTFSLPPVGISLPNCDPTSVSPMPVPGGCCTPTLGTATGAGSSGIDWILKIFP